MNATIGSNNPFAWVQFQLRGGWKRTLLITLGACIVLGALMMLSVVQAATGPGSYHNNVMADWAQGLFILQGAILVLYGAGAIAQSIRNDITGGLIESHRLMPVSAPRAVIGYHLGGGSAALVLGGGVMCMGLFAALAGHVAMDRWLMAQVTLAALMLLIWTISAMGAFVGRVGSGLLITIIVIGFFSGGFIFAFCPGLAILLLPSFGQMSFTSWGQAERLISLALLLQALLAILFFTATVRRYGRDDITCFGVLPALVLLAVWVAMSMLGVGYYGTLLTRSFDPLSLSGQADTTLASIMLLALLPLANASRTAAHSDTSLTPRLDRFSPVGAILGVLTLTGAFAYLIARLGHQPWPTIVQTLVVMAAWLLAMRFLLGWVYKAVEGGFIIGFLWTLLTWFGPMLADVIAQSVLHPDDSYSPTSLFTVSPLGALIQIWSDSTSRPDVTFGLAAQIALILLPLLLFARRRRAPRAVAPVAQMAGS